MSWLRRHVFDVQEKNLSKESQILFEISSHKDQISHYLDILFTYFNDFQDLHFLQEIDLEKEYSFNYPDTLLNSKDQQHLISEIDRFFQALTQESEQMWATLISPSTDITLWDERDMEEYGYTLAIWAENAAQDINEYLSCQEYCCEEPLVALLLVRRTLQYALDHDLDLIYRTWKG
ncbi:hypothetical protein F966_02884 [Acinetobacter higginsii]|uniref:Uncharacterized protein n=1 Tax=Acinetobacter higginsii TaxID=70347 RepID=N8XI84_9GAMM|nr:hypothetical protein [Acinetobacter higginsii]ENV08769.1 hypothetical protein F966_02884 [Acinetobacter higginsii]